MYKMLAKLRNCVEIPLHVGIMFTVNNAVIHENTDRVQIPRTQSTFPQVRRKHNWSSSVHNTKGNLFEKL